MVKLMHLTIEGFHTLPLNFSDRQKTIDEFCAAPAHESRYVLKETSEGFARKFRTSVRMFCSNTSWKKIDSFNI